MAGLEDERRLTCSQCDETFNRQSSLVRHGRLKHSDALEVFKCPECPKILSRKDLLLRHKRLHQGEGLRACGNCSRTVRSDYLARHLRTCLRKAEKSLFGSTQKSCSPPATSPIAGASGLLGKFKWRNVRCNASENGDGPHSVSNNRESTTRRVRQPARFVAAPKGGSTRARPAREPQEVQEVPVFATPPALISPSTGIRPAPETHEVQKPSMFETLLAPKDPNTRTRPAPETPEAQETPLFETSPCRAKVRSIPESDHLAKLIEAIKHDDLTTTIHEVSEWQAAGLTLTEIDELNLAQSGLPLIKLAAWEGSDSCLTFLIHIGFDFNMRGRVTFTPLHCACFNGKTATVSLLLSVGADADPQLNAYVGTDYWPGSTTPLFMAVKRGHIDICRALIQHGADVNGGSGSKGPSPLQCACRNNDVEMAKLLIENGADRHGKAGAPSPLREAMKHSSFVLSNLLDGSSEGSEGDYDC